MKRHYIDCRELPSENPCSVTILADTPHELLKIAIHHAVDDHHYDDTPELRDDLKGMFKVLDADAIKHHG